MRLPDTAHTSRPWRIHELTRDFRLEDVWALPTPGGPGDFPRLVQDFPRLLRGTTSGDLSQGSSRAARALWAIRWKVGGIVYPSMMRQIGRAWARMPGSLTAAA